MWQSRGVAQPGRRDVAEQGRGSARKKGCGRRGAWLSPAEGSQVLEADGCPRLIKISSDATRMPALKLSLGGTGAAACPWEMEKMEEEVGKSSGQQGHPLPTTISASCVRPTGVFFFFNFLFYIGV